MEVRGANTTVVTKWKKRDDVCSGSDEQWLGESAGKRTSRGERGRREAWRPPGRRKVAEFLVHSEEPLRASQPPQMFEGTQALGGDVWLGRPPAFFPPVLRNLWHLALCSQDHEKGMGKHAQRDVAVPSLEGAELILIQSHLPFCFFQTLLHPSTRSNSPDHVAERSSARG